MATSWMAIKAMNSAAARAEAIKASGAIVQVEPDVFMTILQGNKQQLVVVADGHGGFFFGSDFQYLTSYRGLIFYTNSVQPLPLPSDTEVIKAKYISIP